MGDDLAPSNVNRSYSLAGTSIAILTFTLVFLYPRFVSGEIDGLLFQAALVATGVATFSFALAAFHYYGSSVVTGIGDADRAALSRRGDWLWLLGSTLLLLEPALILFAVGLFVVGAVWLALWLSYLLFATRYFPKVQTARGTP